MRLVALALVSCALAACNPSGSGGGVGDVFPSLSGTAYRLEATITNPEDGSTVPVVMVREGSRMRLEMNAPQGASTIIADNETGESIIISTAGGRTMAIRANAASATGELPTDAWGGDFGQTATRTGTCSVAGETGAEWTRTDAADGVTSACVTSDGIILRGAKDGRTTWETTRVDRGDQPDSAFELPPGVQVMDLNDMSGMIERMRNQAGQ